MTLKHIDSNYNITFYSNAKDEYVTTTPSSSMSQSVTEQEVTESVLNNHTWVQSTGSTYNDWAIISGTSAIGTMNPNNSDATMASAVIGLRNEIRGDEIFTSMYGAQSSERNRGIVIYKSSSAGYVLHDYVNIPTASVVHSTSRSYLGREFSIDGEHLIVPIEKNYADSVGGELQIYNSSSSGWSLSTTLTTASYNAGAAVQIDSEDHLAFWNSIVKDNRIFAGIFTKEAGYNDDRYVAIFNSSSGGWVYEDQVKVSGFDIDNEPGNNTEQGGRIGNTRLNFDFDGVTGVLGSKHANGDHAQPLIDDGDDSSGRIHVIKSGSSGWYRDAKLGLEDLDKTGSVDTSHNIPTASYDGSTYPDWYTFLGFGLQGCAVSGNFIAAMAMAKGFEGAIVGGSATYHWRRDTVFIMETGSSGWSIVAELEDPDPHFVGSGSYAQQSDAGFGYGLAFGSNSLMVGSPTWRPDRSGDSGLVSGRTYVYHSTSAGGWSLGQTIENPFSGSQFHTVSSERNEYLGGPQVPGGSGASHFGAKPAMSGNIIVIPAPEFSAIADSNSSSTLSGADPAINIAYIKGAVVVLEGTGSYVDVVSTQYNTESVETTTLVESTGNAIPMRLGMSKGAPNIRLQDVSSSYTTFQGTRTV